MEEYLSIDIEAFMEADHYCHRCGDQLEEVYSYETMESHRLSFDKYRGIAEKSCDQHPFVWIELSETFYSEQS